MNIVNSSFDRSNVAVKLYMIFVLLLMPAFILYSGMTFFADHSFASRQKAVSQELDGIAAILKKHSDEHQYWVENLSAIISRSQSARSFAEQLDELTESHDCKVDYVIYDNQGNHLQSSLPGVENPEAWKSAGFLLRDSVEIMDAPERFVKSGKLRKVFGPDFLLRLWRNLQIHADSELYPTDFVARDYFYWNCFSANLMIIVRFHSSELARLSGLRAFFRNYGKTGFKAALFFRETLVASELNHLEAKMAYLKAKGGTKYYSKKENRLCSIVRVGPESEYLISLELPKGFSSPGSATIFFMLTACFVAVGFARSGLLTNRLENLPLLAQILILVAITTGIPLSALGFAAFGYFSNRPVELLREKQQQMRDFVLEIRRKLPAEHARLARNTRKAIIRNLSLFEKDLTADQDLSALRASVRKVFTFAYLIKDSKFFKLTDRKTQSEIEAQAKSGKENIEVSNVLNISNSYLAEKNGLPLPEIPMEKAYMLEMFLQKSVPEIIHLFISLERKVEQISWGTTVLMFNDAFKVANSPVYNLYAHFNFDAHFAERSFVKRNLSGILANSYGFTTFMVSSQLLVNEGLPLNEFPDVYELFNQIVENVSEPRVIEFAGRSFLFHGEKAAADRGLNFAVLYPMSEIDRIIADEAINLVKIAVMAVSVVLIMVLILYFNLLTPVEKLHRAAVALRQRDSGFRLQNVANDEFGEMAGIFNSSMEELEELQIASLVQSRLLPDKPFSVKGFSIYGKSLPMADLGGDYFDFFELDETKFAIMLGDVAGHGVGAALIMAMAKSTTICARHLAADPAAMLKRLHQIILATKSKVQRKVMTFQYLTVNSANNQMIYANAGGCSPAFIDHKTLKASEITHAGAVLGGFKKNVYNNLELKIEPGQAMIFYTDGMVESRNQSGSELGYQGLFEIFLSSYDPDAQKYYEKIMKNYLQWLGGSEPGDDMTMLILVCQEKCGGPVEATLKQV